MITISYKCRCMTQEVDLVVSERAAVGEDVVQWLKGVAIVAIAADHAKRSPLCMATEMDYVKIPYFEEKPIGTARRN